MNCMRCGQEIASGQVFCEECLSYMQKYPVNPNTPVHLPRQRETASVRKVPKKRTVPVEEQLRILKRRLHFFMAWCLISTVLALLLAVPAVRYLMEDHFALGQNYSSFSVTEPSNSTETTTP